MDDMPFQQSPFRIVKIEWHSEKGEESSSLETCLGDVLRATVDKLIEMTRLLKCMVAEGTNVADGAPCAILAKDVAIQEVVVTKCLLSPLAAGQLSQDVIRFPYRLKRIADMLANVLSCLEKKIEDGIEFSPLAHAELELLFTGLLDILENLGTAFSGSGAVDMASLVSQEKRLGESLVCFRLAHWERLWAGDCSPKASSMYLGILDSVKWANEYLKKICETLMCSEAQASASSSI